MATKVKSVGPLSGSFMYRLADGALEPTLVACKRDEAGTFTAWIADLASDRKGRTIPGAYWEEADLTASEYYTFGAVARAARKAATAVVLGRRTTVKGRFAVELSRLTPATVAGIVLADWREETHDAKKAGFTLNQLMKALRAEYNQ